MTYETIRIEVASRGVADLILARPAKHNALNPTVLRELTAAAAELGANAAARVVVLRGEGQSFCAGGDLAWMKEQFAAGREERMRQGRALALMLRAVNEIPKPVIAAVHGAAYGGGVGLMSVCDTVVAADTAQFGLTETRLGLTPATISPYLIARMGEGAARRVLLSSRVFGAEEAKDLGLVSRVVALGDLEAAIAAEIEPYFATSPAAVAATKALARSLGPKIDDAVITATIERLAETWATPDAQEGVTAFLERRKPRWHN